MTIYVVLGEHGEYSDRNVYVSGVFDNEDEAKIAILKASERRRWHDLWSTREYDTQNRLLYEWFGRGWFLRIEMTDAEKLRRNELVELAATMVGPEPPFERGERFELIIAELGKWISNEEGEQHESETD